MHSCVYEHIKCQLATTRSMSVQMWHLHAYGASGLGDFHDAGHQGVRYSNAVGGV